MPAMRDEMPWQVQRFTDFFFQGVMAMGAACAIAAIANPALATTFPVDTPDDTNDVSPGDGVCSDSSEPAHCSLRADG